MTAPLKILLMLLAWFIYAIVVYTGCLKECCPVEGAGDLTEESAPVNPADSVAEFERYALDFKWSDATAYTNDGFPEMKQSILAKMNENNILEITGLYYEGEESPEGFENMGLARADQIKKLFASADLPEDRIKSFARKVSGAEAAKTGYFEGAVFDWKDVEVEPDYVDELEDRIIIYFPTNSATKLENPQVDEYLDRLAVQLKANPGWSVSITGYTDSDGDPDSNLALGRNRARTVRSILTSKGCSSSQIKIDSMGEADPVASNNTPEGKQKNRRVEVVVNKQ